MKKDLTLKDKLEMHQMLIDSEPDNHHDDDDHVIWQELVKSSIQLMKEHQQGKQNEKRTLQ